MKTKSDRLIRFARTHLLAERLERSLLLGHPMMVDWLLDRAGNELARQTHQIPPLLAAILPGGTHKSDRFREQMVRRLLAAGADPNVSLGGLTPLLLAAGHGTPGIVDALLKAGGDPQAKDYQSRNALHHAAEGNQPAAVVERLLAAGVEIDTEDFHSGRTPLGLYTEHRNKEACRALLAAGADPNARLDPLDISACETAHAIESRTMIAILEEHTCRKVTRVRMRQSGRPTPL